MTAQTLSDFNRLPQRTYADLQKLWADEPVAAAQWARHVADTMPNPPAAATELSALLEAAATKREDATAAFTKFFDEKGKALADGLLGGGAAAPVMGPLGAQLLAKLPPCAPTLTGTLSMNGTTPVLTTPKGAFNLMATDKASGSFLGCYDVQAFVGQTVTVKAWPAATEGVLAVEEFAPGDMANFISGRIAVENGKTMVRVKDDKLVEITDPALAKLLGARAQLGVILPGEVKSKNGSYVFEGKPESYYVLTRVYTQPTDVNARGQMQIQLAHGQYSPGNFDPGVVPQDMVGRGRCFLFGAFGDNGEFEIKGVTKTAGEWLGDGQKVAARIDYTFAPTMAAAHPAADAKACGFALTGPS